MAEENSLDAVMQYGEAVEKVFLGLSTHFGREATAKEVYRFIFGSKETREWIHKNKGLPENQR